MAEETGEEKETPTEDATTPEVEETPTTEQLMETLQTKLDEAVSKAEKAEKRTQGLEGSLQEKDRKLREQTSSNTWQTGMEQRVEILALAMDKGLSPSEVDGEKLNLKQEFATLKESQAKEKAEETAKLQQEEDARVAHDLWTRAKEFGTYQDNDDVAEVYDALVEGKSYKAERIIKRLESKKTVKEEPVESEDKRFEKRLEEEKLKWMKDNNMLVSETGGPSGASLSDEKWLEEEYATGKSSDHARAQKVMSNRT